MSTIFMSLILFILLFSFFQLKGSDDPFSHLNIILCTKLPMLIGFPLILAAEENVIQARIEFLDFLVVFDLNRRYFWLNIIINIWIFSDDDKIINLNSGIRNLHNTLSSESHISLLI